MKKLVERFKLPFTRNGGISEDYRISELDIFLPKITGKAKIPELNLKKLEVQLTHFINERTSIIREAAKYMDQLNKVDIKPSIRQQVNNLVMEIAGPAIIECYKKYVRQGNSFPEDNERKNLLKNCINLLRDLSTSYKIVLIDGYTQPAKKFNQLLDRIQFICIRIFELTLWLQRLLAIRYQMLSNREWKECNQIFSIYSEIGDIGKNVPLTEGMDIHKAFSIGKRKQYTSARDMYISIQLFGLLDMNTWPSQVVHAVDAYIDDLETAVALVNDELQTLNENHIITYRTHDAPPRFERTGEQKGIILDIAPIQEKVRKDKEELKRKQFIGTQEKKRIQPQGTVLAISENLPMLELLEKNLRHQERKENRNPFYGSKYINLYTGFASCYRLLHTLSSADHEDAQKQRKFREAVAQHSSLLIDSESEALESRWQILNESRGGMLVKTGETKYMNAMDVGSLVAFTRGAGDLDRERGIQLGYITRLHRSREGDVDVAIVKISTQSENATVTDPSMESSSEIVPAILIKGLEDQWKLVLPRQNRFVSGSPLMLKRGYKSFPVRLGELNMTKTGFVLFDVRAPNL